MEQIISELKAALSQKKLTIGVRSTIRAKKQGRLIKAIVAKNAPAELLNKLKDAQIDIEQYPGDSESLAIACGKPFNIAVVGLLK